MSKQLSNGLEEDTNGSEISLQVSIQPISWLWSNTQDKH